MNNQVGELAPIIKSEIDQAQSILLHCHPSPDPDSVGSTLAMYHYLQRLGKKVTVFHGDSAKVLEFSVFPGYDQIIEKNYFDLDLSRYDLFLIQDSGGLNLISSLGEVKFPDNLKTVVIDHHKSNPGYGEINLIDPSYPANAQLLYDLFKSWGAEITPEIALCLFLGIYTDTGGFRFASTTPETYAVAADLVRINPNFSQPLFTLFNSRHPDELRLRGMVLAGIKNYLDGHVAVSTISNSQLKDSKIDLERARSSDIVNELISVIGWEIGAVGLEKDAGVVRFSLRTRNPEKYDMSELAKVAGDGGGHRAAAGTKIKGTVGEATEKLVETIKKLHPELSQ